MCGWNKDFGFGSARLGSARLGSARLGSARLFAASLAFLSGIHCGSTDEDTGDQARRPTEGECSKLREHVIDARYAGDRSAEATTNKTVLRDALGSAFLHACQQTLTYGHVRCAMAASDSAGIAGCSSTAGAP